MLKRLRLIIMNIKNSGDVVLKDKFSCGYYLKSFNVFHQYLCSQKQLLILDAYAKIKRSRNELEKPFNKL